MKKKILFIDDDQLRNGSTVSLEYIVRGFYERGFDVYILTWKVNDYVKSIIKQYATIIDGRRFYAPSISLSVYFTFTSSSFSYQGIKRNLKDLLKIVFGFMITFKVLRKVKPDIVYLNEYRMIQSAMAAKCFKIPAVTHVRSRFLKPKFFIRRYLLAKSVLKFCDAIIAITPEEEKQFMQYRKGAAPPIYVIREFYQDYQVDLYKRENLQKELGIPANKKIVTMLGGIRPLKGTLMYLKAAKVVLSLRNDVIFMLVGVADKVFGEEDTSYYKQSMELIESMKEANAFLSIGSVLNPLDYIAISDIIISPYVEPHFSRPVIESWGLKKPVIAVNTQYMLDAIYNNVDGILVDRNNYEQLAFAIIDLLDNEEKRKTLGENGFAKVKKYYDYDENINQIVSVVERIMTDPH